MLVNRQTKLFRLGAGIKIYQMDYHLKYWIPVLFFLGMTSSGFTFNNNLKSNEEIKGPTFNEKIQLASNTKIVFRDYERRVILEYYSRYQKPHPIKWKPKDTKQTISHGLVGQNGYLAPGLIKKEKFPTNIIGELLPQKLLAKLPPSHPGTKRYYFNNQVALVETDTGIILDLIDLTLSMGI